MGGREVTRGVGRPDVKKFAPRNGRTRASGERGANRAMEKPAGPRWGCGNCVKILLPETEAKGLAGSGEQTAPWKSRPAPGGARKLCEDFAPRNGATRASGQRGENRAMEKPVGPRWGRGNCVKILLPGTEEQGLADSGEQTAPWKSRPAPGGGAEIV